MQYKENVFDLFNNIKFDKRFVIRQGFKAKQITVYEKKT